MRDCWFAVKWDVRVHTTSLDTE